MPTSYRQPDFSFEWYHYLRRPWRLRWRWIPLPIHYGQGFRTNYARVSKSLYWSNEQIEAYQWDRLMKLVEHVYRTVPYYQEWFSQAKITPEDIRNLCDFSKLPVIKRADLQDNLAAFTSSDIKKHQGILSKTSGTTGYPLRFYRSQAVEDMRQAITWRHYNQIGYRFKQRRVSLNMTFTGKDADLLYTYEPLENLLAINGSFLLRDTVEDIHELISRFQPVMFFGHPSAISTLGSLIKMKDLKRLNTPIVLVYSEVVTEGCLRTIQNYIGNAVYDYFANRENTVSASQFPCGNYHVNSEFVYLELAESSEEFIDGKLYKVLGTNLMNYAMPLLRYDGDDLAYSMSTCQNCNIQHPVLRFVGGRTKNFLVSKHGLLQCKFDDFLLESGLELLRDFQIEQIDLDNLVLRLVPSDGYDLQRDEEIVVAILKRETRGWFNITAEYVTTIPPTPGFKKAKVISSLGKEKLETG